MDKYFANKKSIALFVLPALILFLVISIVPLFVTGYYSFFDYDGINKMNFIGVDNFIRLFTDKKFTHSTFNASTLMLASVFIQLPISFFIALVLSRGVKGEKLFRTIYFIPVIISSMVIGQLWLNIFNSQHGLLNGLIKCFNPGFDYPWLTNPKTAFLTTVIPALWQYIGYHMLIFYAGLKSIPKDYYEAAMIDGATGVQATIKITIPLLAPIIKTCMIFAIVGSIKAFDLIYIMTGGGPNNVSHVPATLMYSNLFKRGLYGYGSAQAFCIVIACLLISYLITRIFRKAEDNASL